MNSLYEVTKNTVIHADSIFNLGLEQTTEEFYETKYVKSIAGHLLDVS